MHLSIVIPNYNGKKLLERNLPEVIKVFNGTQIVIVDDGSTDGSAAYLKSHYPQIKVIEKVTNSGYATSVNLGVKAANSELVMLLNSDALPERDCLTQLLPHFKKREIFAIGCLEKSEEGNVVVERGRGIGNFRRGFLMHSPGEPNKNDTLWVSGGSGLFRRRIWEELGGMDELYDPFYWEDIDLSYRAQKAGYKILFEPKSRVTHRHSEGSIKALYKDEQIKEIAYRNQFIFIWKNITDTSYLLEHLLWLPYHLTAAIFRGDMAFWRGFIAALIRWPQILKKRQLQKRVILKTDTELLAIYRHD